MKNSEVAGGQQGEQAENSDFGDWKMVMAGPYTSDVEGAAGDAPLIDFDAWTAGPSAEEVAQEQREYEEELRKTIEEVAEKNARVEQERLDQEFLDEMDRYRRKKLQEVRSERRQEYAEQAFNEIFTMPELLAAEAAAGSEKVSKSEVEYEGKKLNVYTLHGRELQCLLHALNFKSKEGSIGYNTARRLQEDPSFWDKGREMMLAVDKGEQKLGSAQDSVSRTLSTFFCDSKKNLSQVEGAEVCDYGFARLKPGTLITMTAGDGNNLAETGSGQVKADMTDTMMTPKQLAENMASDSKNEVLLNRYDEKGEALDPDFILTSSMDGSYISEMVKKHAAYFGVPIISIDQRSYKNQQQN